MQFVAQWIGVREKSILSTKHGGLLCVVMTTKCVLSGVMIFGNFLKMLVINLVHIAWLFWIKLGDIARGMFFGSLTHFEEKLRHDMFLIKKSTVVRIFAVFDLLNSNFITVLRLTTMNVCSMSKIMRALYVKVLKEIFKLMANLSVLPSITVTVRSTCAVCCALPVIGASVFSRMTRPSYALPLRI